MFIIYTYHIREVEYNSVKVLHRKRKIEPNNFDKCENKVINDESKSGFEASNDRNANQIDLSGTQAQ